MAHIVLGMGVSHTPLLTLGPEEWAHRAAVDYKNPKLNMSDGRLLTYDELLAEVGPVHEAVVTLTQLQEKAGRCDAALEKLADELESVRPDVVIIIGDDQTELFTSANQPVLAIFHGSDVVMNGKYGHEGSPEWIQRMGRGYLMDENHILSGSPDLALSLISALIEAEIDVAALSKVEESSERGFGHAYGFIVKRLFRGRQMPIVPVLLNTYYPPNVPTAGRVFKMGQALASALEAAPQDLRIAIVASGGLSHFVVDELLDRKILRAFAEGDSETLKQIPREALNSGSSEILNWIMAAGAMASSNLEWQVYEPLYRTAAGTGVGAAFVMWKPKHEGAEIHAAA